MYNQAWDSMNKMEHKEMFTVVMIQISTALQPLNSPIPPFSKNTRTVLKVCYDIGECFVFSVIKTTGLMPTIV